MKFTRRTFVKGSAALIVAPTIIPSGVLAANGNPGANDRIGLAVIGPGRQGGGLLASAGRSKEVRVVAIADVNLARARQKALPYKAEVYKDYRTMLERKDIDAIITATPEHWRALTCIHACQAGKDVYAEKPMTLTIREGRLMVEATRKYGRIFQCGSQQRSQPENHFGCKFIREGLIGKINKVICSNYPSPWECAFPGEKIPDELDWDLWCGPTEPVPYHSQLYVPRGKPGWLSFRPYSGGEMTGWGAHGFDQIQCALGMDESGPVEVWTDGTAFEPLTYTEPEAGTRGNKQCQKVVVSFRYANGTIMEMGKGNPGGGTFIGEKGTIHIARGDCKSDPKELVQDPLNKALDELCEKAKALKDGIEDPAPPASATYGESKKRVVPQMDGGHMQNWINCIKSRQRPTADVETGHRSATVCHMGNIARWTGKRLKWDPVKEVFDDAQANTYLDRKRRKGFELPEKI